jgi:hypothetical protein
MAFTITVVPHMGGDIRMNRIIATFDGVASNNHELATTVAQLGLSQLLAFVPDGFNTESMGFATRIHLGYDRNAAKIVTMTGVGGVAQCATSDAFTPGKTLSALAIGV